MIQFPGDSQRENTSTQSMGGYRNTGGAERFNMIDANKITVYDIQANTASIRDASITTAKIGNLQVTTALIANLAVEEGKIGNLAVTNAKINDLSAAKINTGTLTVGSGGATAIAIKHSGTKTDAIVRWEGGSGVWEDANNYMGLWSYGGDMYFWCAGNTDPVLYLGTGNVNVYQHMHVVGIDLSLGGQTEGSISRIDRLVGYNDMWIVGNGDVKFPRDDQDGAGARIEWGTGKIFSYSSTINLGGTDKTAIVKTKDGYNALYCAESPEVWFFDFCKSQLKKDIDPMFLEVTEGPMRFIKCEDGWYQVWRRRKGRADRRFESKTALQFRKNELFYGLAK